MFTYSYTCKVNMHICMCICTNRYSHIVDGIFLDQGTFRLEALVSEA